MATSAPSALPANAELYWQHTAAESTSHNTHEEVYLQVGQALSTWESIEYTFVTLFCHFVEPRINNAAERAFGAISTSSGRMEALDKAAEVYFHIHSVSDALKNEFKLLKNTLRKRAQGETI